MADTITDPADFMVAPLIGNIFVIINKTCCIKDDVVMNVVFVNMGTDHVFIEFDLLKRQILFIIRREPHTLKQLCEITNRSRSYVLAALKDLDQVLGGYGGGLGKGYFIVSSEKDYYMLHVVQIGKNQCSIVRRLMIIIRQG